MNPFLACFLACALVQVIVLVGGFQYVAWKRRKDEAESTAAMRAYPTPPEGVRAAIANPDDVAKIQADHRQLVADHSVQLMRINTQMHGESFRVLANITESLRAENESLRTANMELLAELAAAKR